MSGQTLAYLRFPRYVTVHSDTASYTGNGTSFAAPHVAGAAALYLSAHTSEAPAQVQTALENTATNGVVRNPGAGSPNRLLYTGP